MRFVHITLAFLISTGCLLASTADARAQSCNNFTPQLQGNFQQQLGSNACAPLTGMSVTVQVTQDIKVAGTTQGQGGFGMQLNTNGPSNPPSGQLDAAQFVIRANTSGVQAYTQLFPSSGLALVAPNPVFMGKPSTVNDTFLTIPAGTVFKWYVNVDTNTNKVTGWTAKASDSIGTTYTTVTTQIPLSDQSPLYSLSVQIIGYGNCSNATFQSGAGTITYNGISFDPLYNAPGNGGCSYNFGSCESSNMVYGPMPGSGDTRVQTFSASEVANFRNGDCEPASTYPSGDWAPGDYKAECPLTAPVYGVSRVPSQTWSEDIECGMPQQSAYNNNGTGCYAQVAEPYDNRGDTDNGWDWDPGSYKTECRANEYVAGVSQWSGNGVLASILCCPASVTHQSCDAQVFSNGDSRAYTPPDWNSGYYKGQCPAGQYVAGISSPAYASVGIIGSAHAILCCTQ
jgi:hypothetical protein